MLRVKEAPKHLIAESTIVSSLGNVAVPEFLNHLRWNEWFLRYGYEVKHKISLIIFDDGLNKLRRQSVLHCEIAFNILLNLIPFYFAHEGGFQINPVCLQIFTHQNRLLILFNLSIFSFFLDFSSLFFLLSLIFWSGWLKNIFFHFYIFFFILSLSECLIFGEFDRHLARLRRSIDSHFSLKLNLSIFFIFL